MRYDPTAESVLLHATGGTDRYTKTVGWRVHYAASPGTSAQKACEEAVAKGWMKRGNRQWELIYYFATKEGVERVSELTGRPIDKRFHGTRVVK